MRYHIAWPLWAASYNRNTISYVEQFLCPQRGFGAALCQFLLRRTVDLFQFPDNKHQLLLDSSSISSLFVAMAGQGRCLLSTSVHSSTGMLGKPSTCSERCSWNYTCCQDACLCSGNNACCFTCIEDFVVRCAVDIVLKLLSGIVEWNSKVSYKS